MTSDHGHKITHGYRHWKVVSVAQVGDPINVSMGTVLPTNRCSVRA